MKGRSYQDAAVQAVLDYWRDGGGDALIEAATGTGKALMQALLAQALIAAFPDLRIIMSVHVQELVEQNAKTLLRLWPDAPVGINSAGLGRRDTHHRILVTGIGSVFRSPHLLGARDVLFVDEAHLIPRSGNGMYRSLIADLRRVVPDMRVCGFTATPYRLDSGRMDEGEERLFDKTVFAYPLGQAVEDGYLKPLVSKSTTLKLDVSGVGKRGGEFIESELQDAIDQADVTERAVIEIVDAMARANRKSCVVFCTGVRHAENVAAEFLKHNVAAASVTGDTDKAVRAQYIQAFREQRISVLTSMAVLTTGFDAPRTDLIAFLRPTLSPGLYLQMLGRGTRPVYPQGFDTETATAEERRDAIANTLPNCLVLDFAGNVMRHGPADDVKPPRKKRAGEREVVMAKACPACQSLVALACRTCPDCGHEWTAPVVEPKHNAEADATSVVMSVEHTLRWLPVRNTFFYANAGKPDGKGGVKPDTLRVEYDVGNKSYREYICLAHEWGSFPAQKARAWWLAHGGTEENLPEGRIPTAEECIRALGNVTEITVTKRGDFYDVARCRLVIDGVTWELDAQGGRREIEVTIESAPVADPRAAAPAFVVERLKSRQVVRVVDPKTSETVYQEFYPIPHFEDRPERPALDVADEQIPF